MIFLRSILYQLFLVCSAALFSLVIVLTGPFVSHRQVSQIAQVWARWNLSALRFICRLHLRIHGQEYLPDTTSIVLCKHQSAWETIALRAMLPPEQTWVLKAELLRVPLFGRALRWFVPIAIDRSLGRKAIKQLLVEGECALRLGRWVVVFPEGTRVAHGEKQVYGGGGALLAERTGYPIVPIAHNAGLFWPRRSLVKYPGTIDLVVGPPIVTKGRITRDINRDVEEWIEGTVSRLPQNRIAGIS